MSGIKPMGKVKKIWSPELAYAVGLLATDGNLSKDGRHIDFTSKDLLQIRNFKKCLGLSNKIGRKSRASDKQKKYFRLQFGDKLFYKWLMDLGMMPNKSKIMGRLNVPDKYFFDFLRGCFDGDGCINGYQDPRWPTSYMFYLRFMSASLKYLKWLDETVLRLCKAQGRIKSSTRQYELVFAKKASRLVFKEMFRNKNGFFLKRKFLKAKGIFETDNKFSAARVMKLVNMHV